MTDTNHRHLSTSDEKTEQQVPDIVERLREQDTYINHSAIAYEAADEIERLRDQIKTVSAMNVKLVEALEVVVAKRDDAARGEK